MAPTRGGRRIAAGSARPASFRTSRRRRPVESCRLVRADEEGAMTTIGFSTVERLPRLLLHLEGVAAAIAAVVVYFWADHPWWLLLVLVLAPDLSMAAYAAGPRIVPPPTTSSTRTQFPW